VKKGWKIRLQQEIPLPRALIWIFLTTFLVSGSATLGWLNYERIVANRLEDPSYTLKKIVIQGEGLDPQYIAEVMGLSVDRSTNYYEFDPYEARMHLEASPLIQRAYVLKKKPNEVHVHYIARSPVAQVGDVSNMLVDQDGILMPKNPLFAQLDLPVIRFGFDPATFQYGLRVEGRRWDLAKEFISLHDPLVLKAIDLTNAYASTYGEREVIMTVGEGDFKRILRLSTRRSRQEISDYLHLRDEINNRGESGISDQDLVIDLRLPQLAYMKPFGGENVGIHTDSMDSGKH
jgi:hypothetical protein